MSSEWQLSAWAARFLSAVRLRRALYFSSHTQMSRYGIPRITLEKVSDPLSRFSSGGAASETSFQLIFAD